MAVAQWSKSPILKDVGFLCVTTDFEEGEGTAQYFAENFDWRNVTNGFCETEEDLPEFGQLACSGFILIRPDGTFLLE